MSFNIFKIAITVQMLIISLLFYENLYAEESIKCTQTTVDNLEHYVPWSAPKYDTQTEVLGYEHDTFKVTPNIQKQVQFWIDIYTKYSTKEGVVHDSDNPSLVYETLDLGFIVDDEHISLKQKEKAKDKLVKQAKERILFSLKKLASHPSEGDLNTYDLMIRSKFDGINDNSKYFKAADMGQLRFQSGLSNRMKQAIQNSGRFLPYMESIFKNEGLPIELTRIPFVESSFNVFSYSKVGASGLWQIMPSVARGQIKMNSTADYRNHPIEATRMAAQIFKANYLKLNSWPLAITAYNHGVNGMKRLVEKNETKDLNQIIETGEVTRNFGFASRNFYYTFLAALEVEKNAATYFKDLCKIEALPFAEMIIKKPKKFSEVVDLFNGDLQLALLYNPHFHKKVYLNKTRLPANTNVLVPEDQLVKTSKDKVVFIKNTKVVSNTISVKKNSSRKYKVTRGDTLYAIAKQFRVPVKKLLSLNNLYKPKNIKIGQILLLSE